MNFRYAKQFGRADLDVESKICIEYVIEQAKQRNWYLIYLLSEHVAREVSILVDNSDNYWVDWGTIGSVHLRPPLGAVLPFKLWVHTHPSNTAYWSITDRTSLEMAKGILEEALVLGQDGLLSTNSQQTRSTLEYTVNSNLHWTEEEVVSWSDYYCEDMSEYRHIIYDSDFASKWMNKREYIDDLGSDN